MKMKILFAFILTSSILAGGCSSGNTVSVANHKSRIQRDASNSEHAGHDMGAGGHASMQSSPGAAEADYDLQFLDTMIAHHQGAVEMARLALTKNSHPEIQALANTMNVSQEKEIAQMKEWREAWFRGKPQAVNMDMAGMKDSMKGMDMQGLQSLDGQDFDVEFIHQMTPHHEGAVVMAKEAVQKSQRPEIKELANQIITAQQKEVKQMAEWDAAWDK
jgi:uncharacterized protein (DUF305 family)